VAQQPNPGWGHRGMRPTDDATHPRVRCKSANHLHLGVAFKVRLTGEE